MIQFKISDQAFASPVIERTAAGPGAVRGPRRWRRQASSWDPGTGPDKWCVRNGPAQNAHLRRGECPKCRAAGRVCGGPLGTACAPVGALGQVMVPGESTAVGRVRDGAPCRPRAAVPHPAGHRVDSPATKAQRSARAYHPAGRRSLINGRRRVFEKPSRRQLPRRLMRPVRFLAKIRAICDLADTLLLLCAFKTPLITQYRPPTLHVTEHWAIL